MRTHSNSKKNIAQLMSYYYLATPVFLLIELVLGGNVRVVIPGDSHAFLYIYLAVCFAAGIFLRNKPSLMSLFGLVESIVNIALLILNIYLPVVMLGGQLEGESGPLLTYADILHFIIVGTVLLAAFYSNSLFRNVGRF